MLENRSCESYWLFASSCQQGTKWSYMFNGKRSPEFGESDGTSRETKLCKLSSDDSSSDDNNDTNTSTTFPQGLPDLLLPVSPDQSDDDSKQSESSSDLDSSLIHRHPIGLDKPDLNVQSDDDSLSNSVEDSPQEPSMEDDDKGISDSPMGVEEDGAREHVGDLSCSSSDYGSIALLNRSFRSLIRSGEIYKLRRQNGVVEDCVYFSCHLLQWEAFDPIRYRCLFATDSLGEIAILVGGCDSQGNILSSAEMYNSETQKWETLPSMNKSRKMCSRVFMDGKFYVIGGVGGVGKDTRVLTSGEDRRSGAAGEAEIPVAVGAPHHVAVVNDELYAAVYADMEVKKYDKERNSWVTIGRLPERAVSINVGSCI
ncbi:hypothetical protein ES332_D12G198700v1 [Gossypium tomentosum]|uniref:Uncharacterized protein n=1 Tax=Gossypium tomentosum TaxID=34277 RepID=A0A5D2IBH0_GOSTO|nr:hypothetical protein ES332_D12G198700v1 [Gossypium tomentosum]